MQTSQIPEFAFRKLRPRREVADIESLRTMLREVRQVAPERRAEVTSVVVATSVRESLGVAPEVIELIGRVFDTYRRFRSRLVWHDGSPA